MNWLMVSVCNYVQVHLFHLPLIAWEDVIQLLYHHCYDGSFFVGVNMNKPTGWYIFNICWLSENVKLICTSFRKQIEKREHGELFPSFPQRVQINYTWPTYIVFMQPRQNAQTNSQIVFKCNVCPRYADTVSYRSLYMNQISEYC
jgi:hypothetical protein